MPGMTIVKRLISNGLPATVGSGTDASANLAAYQAYHINAVSGLSEVIDRSTYRYFLLVTTESGAGANVGSLVYDCYAPVTVTALDDAAG